MTRIRRTCTALLARSLVPLVALAACGGTPALVVAEMPPAAVVALHPTAAAASLPILADGASVTNPRHVSARVASHALSAPSPSSSPDSFPWGLGLVAVGGMVALAKDRDTPLRGNSVEVHPVAAAKKIYAGSLVVLSGGYVAPGSTALNLIAVGRANEQVDNSAGAAGDLNVEVERGVFLFGNDGSIAQADVGKTAYIVDDQTVADTDGTGTRSAAGTIRGVESGGVWVEI